MNLIVNSSSIPLELTASLNFYYNGVVKTAFLPLPSFIIQFGIITKMFKQKGDLKYEYNPFRNLRVETDRYNSNGKLTLKKGQLIDFTVTGLDFDINKPVEVELQTSYDGSVNMILNDDKNVPFIVNSRFTPLEDDTYEIIDRKGGNDTNIYSEINYKSQIRLYKTSDKISQVYFDGLENGGKNKVGNYSFYFKYADVDGNETDVVMESGIVPCYIGNVGDTKSIRGGILHEASDKIIKFKIKNIDTSYDYLNIYYVRDTSDYNKERIKDAQRIINKFPIDARSMVTDSDGVEYFPITITGFEETEPVSIEDVNVDYSIISSAKTQCQVQNMLFFGNINKETIEYKELNDLALRIYPTISNDKNIGYLNEEYVDISDSDTKNEYFNEINCYNYTGYWDKEIYSFGIVYILHNNSLSPVFPVRGCNNLGKLNTSIEFKNAIKEFYTYKPLRVDGERSYIEEGVNFSIVDGSSLENTKGVLRINGFKYPIIENGTERPLGLYPYGISFNVEGETLTEMKKYAKGFFFVRQKRIPTILCQGITIGKDDYSSLPMLYGDPAGVASTKLETNTTNPFILNIKQKLIDNNNKYNSTISGPAYFTECFVGRDRILTHSFANRIYKNITEVTEGAVLLSPDPSLNSEYYSQLFTGSNFVVSRANHQPDDSNRYFISSANNARHFYIPKYKNLKTTPILQRSIKLTLVEDGVSRKTSGTSTFSSRAGIPEEAWRFSFVGKEDRDKQANNIARGYFCSYVGLEGYNKSMEIIDVHIAGYSHGIVDDYFISRYNSNQPYFAISNRYDLNQLTIKPVNNFVEYRGDCFISNHTIRIQRNFQDPEMPISDSFVDVKTWSNNYKGMNASGGVVADNLKKINRNDVNAVQIGHWATMKLFSNVNTAFRCIDESKPTEKALTGFARGFYPAQAMSHLGPYKMPESTMINGGYQNTVPNKVHITVPDVPYLKNFFFNRIMYSEPTINDAFRNGYRIFKEGKYRDYPVECGAIVKILSWGSDIMVVFEHGVGLLMINERTALQNENNEAAFYIDGSGTLPTQIRYISGTYGTIWKDSIVATQNYVYGVDTYAKKIWRTNGEQFETISDFRIQEFLNQNITLSERDKTPILAVRNVVAHYNTFKQDVMFTFYDLTRSNKEVTWNICFNELMNKWITRYDWIPLTSAGIDNIFFTYDREGARKIAMMSYCNKNKEYAEGLVLSKSELSGNDDSIDIDLTYDDYNKLYEIELLITEDSIVNEGDPSQFNQTDFYISKENGIFKLRKKNTVTTLQPFYMIKVKVNLRAKNNPTGPILNSFWDYLAFRPTIGYYSQWLSQSTGMTVSACEELYKLEYSSRFWKHGQAGIFDWADEVLPCKWYGKQHAFEFEFVVADNPSVQKIYDNLTIISNNAEPDSFEFEVVGDSYAFDYDYSNGPYIYNSNNKYITTADGNSFKLYQKGLDIKQHGRIKCNMEYKEDLWNIQIKPFNFAKGINVKEAKIRDKYIKIRVRYSGTKRAVISSIITLYTISYA